MNDLVAGKKPSLIQKIADKFGVDPEKMMNSLKETAFKVKDKTVTNEQMMALLVVADQYGLNPYTKEIFAYPDKGGIVPVVGVDGWSRIINESPQLDGIDFKFSEEKLEHKGIECHTWIECIIYRKDRTHPTIVREYFAEVVRKLNYATPWDSHPNRMHRHKALIQCARIAFGFVGIYDQDEAERIIEKDVTPKESHKSVGRADLDSLTPEQQSEVRDAAISFSTAFRDEDILLAHEIYDDTHERGIDVLNAFWSLVPSNQRTAWKKKEKQEKMVKALMLGQPEDPV